MAPVRAEDDFRLVLWIELRSFSAMTKRKGNHSAPPPKKSPLSEKRNPPVLSSNEGLNDEELFEQAMADVEPIPKKVQIVGRGRKARVPGHSYPAEEDPLQAFMEDSGQIETRHRPGYVEGGNYGSDRSLIRKLRRGDFSIQESLDLHGFTQAEARKELDAFLRESVKEGLSCVRIVHGKGHNSPAGESVLKKMVPEWLGHRRNSRYVLAFTSAPVHDGGSGATYVLLRLDREWKKTPRARRKRKRSGW
jgi:DNA-nicking Smr family endonuclease